MAVKPGDTITLEPPSSSVPEHRRTVQKRQAVKSQGIRSGLSTVRNASAPDLKNPTGGLLGLLALNFAWTVWRGTVTNPGHILPTIMRSAAGLWFVGLGVLLVAEFNPQLAVLFMVLITIGNVLQDNGPNMQAISILNTAFGKAGS